MNALNGNKIVKNIEWHACTSIYWNLDTLKIWKLEGKTSLFFIVHFIIIISIKTRNTGSSLKYELIKNKTQQQS